MSFIRSAKLLQKYNSNHRKVLTVISRHAQLNRDWKPGPYPETEEERIAAAKKYYMLPEEYEPYPKDFGNLGGGIGDYPRLPFRHFDDKDPFYAYDYPSHGLNFKEPVPYQIPFMSFDFVNASKKMPVTFWQVVYRIAGTIGLVVACGYVGEYIRWSRSMLIQHMPANGEFYFYPEK